MAVYARKAPFLEMIALLCSRQMESATIFSRVKHGMTHDLQSNVHGLDFYLVTGYQMPLKAGFEVHPVPLCA